MKCFYCSEEAVACEIAEGKDDLPLCAAHLYARDMEAALLADEIKAAQERHNGTIH